MKSKARARASLTVVVASVLVGSCGGDGGGSGGGPFTTSVPGAKPINTLTAAEATTLCADIRRAYSASWTQEDICRFSAYYAAVFSASASTAEAELKATCAAEYDACSAQGRSLGPATCATACAATVTELAKCVNDMKADLDRRLAEAPACAAVTREGVSTALEPANLPKPPASCAALAMKCPGGAPIGTTP